MAKKGGVQQLQADLQNDEDFERFLERPGLLVLDVYSEWCGPCLGMVGSLRKIKLEVGGDNLQLAIGGKAVNIMFGTDVPKLMALVTRELERTIQKVPRNYYYDIAELQAIELEQRRVKMEAIEKADRIEREAKHRKQTDYLNQVTDSIMENMPDIGVTVFGPQVNRDMFKKLTEPAEALKMQCKDRKVVQVTADQFEIVNYACKNPMPPDVLEQLEGKELLMCFWKIDETVGTVPNVLAAYAHELTKERVAPPNEQFDEDHIIPPIISPMKIKLEVELKEGEIYVEEISSEEEQKPGKSGKGATKAKSSIHLQEDVHPAPVDEEPAEPDAEGEEGSEEDGPEMGADGLPSFPSMPFDMDLDLGDDMGEEEEEVKEEEPPKLLTRTKTVKMPPVWVPSNRRTHAALVYVFFRGQTSGFLAPDPKPDPPHVIMAFDASKRREIMHVVDRHKEEVPLFGYFTNDDPDEAELIANSTEKYDYSDQLVTDKIVLKVNKVQSNMMLSLVSYGPSYVSPNVMAGHDEALKFFPENYKQQQEEVPVETAKKKKKKGKKSEELDAAQLAAVASIAPAEEAAPAPPTEAPSQAEAVAASEATDKPPEVELAEGTEAAAAAPVEEATSAPPQQPAEVEATAEGTTEAAPVPVTETEQTTTAPPPPADAVTATAPEEPAAAGTPPTEAPPAAAPEAAAVETAPIAEAAPESEAAPAPEVPPPPPTEAAPEAATPPTAN